MYMSLSSDKKFLFLIKYVLIPFVAVKFLYSILFFYIDKAVLPIDSGGNISFITKTKLGYKFLDSVKTAPKEIEVVGKKITDFKLKGTYVSSGDDSFVIIDDMGNTEFVYLGENYQGYKLVKVYENRAIFEKDGQNYELSMYAQESEFTSNTPDVDKDKYKQKSSSGDYVVPIDVSKSDVDFFAKNPEKIWNNIRIKDFRTEDGIEFRVGYVKSGTVFDKIGLKSGDVIVAIDGQTPQSMADVMKYYTNIDSLESLMLTIKRKEQIMDLEFRVKE